jgi:Tol biopolymer transport system component
VRRTRRLRSAAALAFSVASASCREPGDAAHSTAAALAGSSAEGLVFARRAGESLDLFRLRLSDGAVRALVSTSDRDESWPSWSPGAARVLYQAESRGVASDLFLLDPATGETSQATRTPAREEHWPAWAPDGRAFAYAFRGGRPGAGIAARATAAAPADAPELLASAEPPLLYLRPELSPDGRSAVAQQRRDAQDTATDLWILPRVPGAAPRLLVADRAWHQFKAAFTRDGARVIFSRRPRAGGAHSIWSIAAAGGEPVVLFESPGSDQHSARPSPARDELAFSSTRAGNGSFDLFVGALDGGAPHALCNTPERDELAPRWSPDGERIAAIAVPRGSQPKLADLPALHETRIVVFDREGKRLVETEGMMPDWMPAWRD